MFTDGEICLGGPISSSVRRCLLNGGGGSYKTFVCKGHAKFFFKSHPFLVDFTKVDLLINHENHKNKIIGSLDNSQLYSNYLQCNLDYPDLLGHMQDCILVYWISEIVEVSIFVA